MEHREPAGRSVGIHGACWTLRYEDAKGVRRRIRLGRADELDREAAEKKADDFLHAEGAPVARPRLPVAKLVEEHLAELASYCAPGTVRYRRHILEQAARHFEGTPATCIDAAAAQGYVAMIAARGGLVDERLSPNSVEAYVRALRVMWKSALRRKQVDRNPWEDVKLPRRVVRDRQVLEADEADRLVAACDERIRPLVSILCETGLRVGEALALRWQDVRLRESRFHVRKSKTRRPRVVWMTPRAEAAFKVALARCGLRGEDGIEDFVCQPLAGDGGARPMSESRIRELFKEALESAGLPRMRVHDLRHSVGYRLGAAGCNESAIADVLGHSETKTTALYVRHKRDTAAKRAMDQLAAHEEGLREGRKAE